MCFLFILFSTIEKCFFLKEIGSNEDDDARGNATVAYEQQEACHSGQVFGTTMHSWQPITARTNHQNYIDHLTAKRVDEIAQVNALL